jgi:hypothetical protein
MFQKIINKTAHNFIDIAQSPGMLQQHHHMMMHGDHFHHYDSYDSQSPSHKQSASIHHSVDQHHAHPHGMFEIIVFRCVYCIYSIFRI